VNRKKQPAFPSRHSALGRIENGNDKERRIQARIRGDGSGETARNREQGRQGESRRRTQEQVQPLTIRIDALGRRANPLRPGARHLDGRRNALPKMALKVRGLSASRHEQGQKRGDRSGRRDPRSAALRLPELVREAGFAGRAKRDERSRPEAGSPTASPAPGATENPAET